jgi:hypothetical protein
MPITGTPGVQQPQQPDISATPAAPAAATPQVAGGQSANSQARHFNQEPINPAAALAPGPLAGVNSEFSRGG